MKVADKEVSIKVSTCNDCLGIIRVAVEHLLNDKSKKEFFKEVMKYNLNVKTISLIEYRKDKSKWCKCK